MMDIERIEQYYRARYDRLLYLTNERTYKPIYSKVCERCPSSLKDRLADNVWSPVWQRVSDQIYSRDIRARIFEEINR